MRSASNGRRENDLYISIGLALVFIFFIVTTYIAYYNTRTISADSASVTRTHDTINTLDDLLSLVKDAETGQRGFVITGNEHYLQPYNNALGRIEEQYTQAQSLMKDTPEQAAILPVIKQHIDAKQSRGGRK